VNWRKKSIRDHDREQVPCGTTHLTPIQTSCIVVVVNVTEALFTVREVNELSGQQSLNGIIISHQNVLSSVLSDVAALTNDGKLFHASCNEMDLGWKPVQKRTSQDIMQ